MYIRQLLITICIVCVLYFLYKTYDRYTERKQIVKHKASIKRLETKIKKKPIDYYKLEIGRASCRERVSSPV